MVRIMPAALMIGQGAKIHRGHVDHVAVEIENRSVVARPNVPTQLGVAVHVSADNPQRFAVNGDPMGAGRFDLGLFAGGVPSFRLGRRLGGDVIDQHRCRRRFFGLREHGNQRVVTNGLMIVRGLALVAGISHGQAAVSQR